MRTTVSLCYCNVVQIYSTDSISSSAQRFFVHFLFFWLRAAALSTR